MKNLLFAALYICLSMSIYGQPEFPLQPKNHFIGIQPLITVTPYDAFYNTVEINILPFVYEGILSQRVGFKVFPILNYQINPEKENTFSHTGFGLSLPLYLNEREKILPYSGLFGGPHLSYTYNQTELYNSFTYAAELGYNFLIKEKYAFVLDIQYGRTLLFNSTIGKSLPHIGMHVQFGIWL
ncbi:MAG: hypothetical protein HOD63_00145 [Bacteroidetes bacterium]|jgi:hypothetical protein|nr:hypothetical protein [Bacteroidota bacterium]MBT3933475.1 hypothetical protein [Bacteroidota bacterium]MBT4336980.1 hypothetical protein [Bacteroidota bacterium]MBT7826830.1 hypothetical protein [Bacteroidota bacterium]MBT7994098.1 hypothetical protein [Bacteroidota bacterium]